MKLNANSRANANVDARDDSWRSWHVVLAHPAIGWQAIPFFVHLTVSIETDPDETERGLLHTIMRSDEDCALVLAHGARHVVIALQRRIINDITRQHIQLHAVGKSRASQSLKRSQPYTSKASLRTACP